MTLDFLCVGPQRTGTTWLHEMLLQHPSLILPSAVKETMFFDRRYDRGIEWYESYFCQRNADDLCGEVAPTYFDFTEAPDRIYRMSSDCDIFINLRHPVERAFSLYLHHLRKGRVAGSFWEAVEQKPRILSAGEYATHIPRWVSTFGEDQVHFLFMRDIKNNPKCVLDNICQTLEINNLEHPNRSEQKVNTASMPRSQLLARGAAILTTFFHSCGLHSVVEIGKRLGLRDLVFKGGEASMPELSTEVRNRLLERYIEDVKFVESATGKTLPHWRE